MPEDCQIFWIDLKVKVAKYKNNTYMKEIY